MVKFKEELVLTFPVETSVALATPIRANTEINISTANVICFKCFPFVLINNNAPYYVMMQYIIISLSALMT